MRASRPWRGERFPIGGSLPMEEAWDLLADAIDGDPECRLRLIGAEVAIAFDGVGEDEPGWRISAVPEGVRPETLRVVHAIMEAFDPDLRTVTPHQTSAGSPPEERIETLPITVVWDRTGNEASATLAALLRRQASEQMPDLVRAPRERLSAFLSKIGRTDVYEAYVAA